MKFEEDAFSCDAVEHPASILNELINAIPDQNNDSSATVPYVAIPDSPQEEAQSSSHEDPAADDQELNQDMSFEAENYEAENESVPPASPVSHHPPHMSRVPLHHSSSQIIGDPAQGVQRRHQVSNNFCMFVNFVSLMEPKKINEALQDSDWIKAMKDELLEFERQKVWTLVPRPTNKTIIGTRWVY